MRHRRKTLKLGRKQGPRKALLRNLVIEVILHGKIQTTISKAKFIRPRVERAITRGKTPGLATFRLLAGRLNPAAAKKLTTELGPKYRERPGGYTRIIRLGRRYGDAAETAQIELV